MSEQELIESYVKGGISRRVFIRGLMVSGVSLAAALAYAETIAPTAFGSGGSSGYGLSGGSGGAGYFNPGGSGGSGLDGGAGGGGAPGGTP